MLYNNILCLQKTYICKTYYRGTDRGNPNIEDDYTKKKYMRHIFL